MFTFLTSLCWLLLTLGLLIAFHEFGHFIVARWCGVHVTRFSLGFGRPLWERTTRRGLTVAVAVLPLGGYIKMFDTREGNVPPEREAEAYDRQPPHRRIAICAAGPIANILFAIAALWLMGVIGMPDYQPTLDTPRGMAAEAGLKANDRIVGVDGRPVSVWSEAVLGIGTAAVSRRDVELEVRGEDGTLSRHILPLSGLTDESVQSGLFKTLGLALAPRQVPSEIRTVRPGLPAEAAGLRAGDRFQSVAGNPVRTFPEFSRELQRAAALQPAVPLTVDRQGQTIGITVQAQQQDRGNGTTGWVIGVVGPDPHDAELKYGPLAAVPFALRETGDNMMLSLQLLGRMAVGLASPKHLSGPITIAREANNSAEQGVAWFLRFLAVLSLGLAVINLLPIPVLDGGHILYDVIELLRGRPVSDRVRAIGYQAGFFFLAGMMSLALCNDLVRVFS